MRWLALLLVLVAGRTSAERCTHAEAKVFPTLDLIDVPTNSHLWIRADVPGPYGLEDALGTKVLSSKPFRDSQFVEIDPGPLLPEHMYRITANGLGLSWFKTGRVAQAQPPPAPVVGHLHITDGIVDMPVQSPGAMLLHVTIHRGSWNGDPLADIWGPRGGIRGESLPCLGVWATLGDTLCFDVSAVGGNGLESGGTSRCAVDKLPEKEPPAPVVTVPPEPSPDVWILASAVVLALLFVGLRAGRERLYAKVCEPQPIDRVTVGWIARRQLIRRLMALAMIAAATYVVLPIAALGVVVAADLWRLARVARAVTTGWPMIADPPRRRAYVTDGIYFQGWITVSPGDLERVTAAHMPAARVV